MTACCISFSSLVCVFFLVYGSPVGKQPLSHRPRNLNRSAAVAHLGTISMPTLVARVPILYYWSPSMSGKSLVTAITTAKHVINRAMKATLGLHIKGAPMASLTAQ